MAVRKCLLSLLALLLCKKKYQMHNLTNIYQKYNKEEKITYQALNVTKLKCHAKEWERIIQITEKSEKR